MHGQKTIAVQLDDELFFHAANFEFFQRKSGNLQRFSM